MTTQTKNIEEILNKVDVSKLDRYETILYWNFIEKSGMDKGSALKVLLNDVEGDYYQLSPVLRRIYKKYYI